MAGIRRLTVNGQRTVGDVTRRRLTVNGQRTVGVDAWRPLTVNGQRTVSVDASQLVARRHHVVTAVVTIRHRNRQRRFRLLVRVHVTRVAAVQLAAVLVPRELSRRIARCDLTRQHGLFWRYDRQV